MSLDFYRHPVDLSDPAQYAPLFADLPAGPAATADVVQGLLIHEHIAAAYGVTLTQPQHAEAHLRPVSSMLAGIAGRDAAPLRQPRPPDARQTGVCRHFALLQVAMLRSKGLPARARCGFGAYFEAGKFLDHWVTEYWNEGEGRWVMVDAQMDPMQRALFRLAFDPLDVPASQFLVAGAAWTLCRAGKADPTAFGILDMHGLWFIASNVIRDLAALNNREMLPWDGWGTMIADDRQLDLALIDHLAALTQDPDRRFEELQAVYRDPRLVVPETVFNHVLNRAETV